MANVASAGASDRDPGRFPSTPGLVGFGGCGFGFVWNFEGCVQNGCCFHKTCKCVLLSFLIAIMEPWSVSGKAL